MIQPPLFPLPPESPKPNAQDRLQALCDALFGDPEHLTNDHEIVRRRDGWYLCGSSRWFGDDGCDWIGHDEQEAAARIREIAR